MSMTRKQHDHVLNYLSVMQGILTEASAKQEQLQVRLAQHPDFLPQVEREASMLESNIDAIQTALEFIDAFPVDPLETFDIRDLDLDTDRSLDETVDAEFSELTVKDGTTIADLFEEHPRKDGSSIITMR